MRLVESVEFTKLDIGKGFDDDDFDEVKQSAFPLSFTHYWPPAGGSEILYQICLEDYR